MFNEATGLVKIKQVDWEGLTNPNSPKQVLFRSCDSYGVLVRLRCGYQNLCYSGNHILPVPWGEVVHEG